MKKKKKIQISIILESGIAAAIIVLKLIYYIEKYQHGFFGNFIVFLLWSLISISISVFPAIYFITSMFLIYKNADLNRIDYKKIRISFKWTILNIVFEMVSVIGGTMSMDSLWIDIAVRMQICHIVSFIIIIINKKIINDMKRITGNE